MLKEKHCNYGIRGVKWIYEAIQRAKIEAFEDWLSRKNKFVYHRFLQSKEFNEMCSNRNAESFKAALEKVSGFIFPVWRVPKYFARWGREPHACVLDGFPWHDSSVTWLCEIHLYWQLGTFWLLLNVCVHSLMPMTAKINRNFSCHWCRQKLIKDFHSSIYEAFI